MKPPNWFHRLHCQAFAGRAANSYLSLPNGEVMLTAGCRACGWTRIAMIVTTVPGSFLREGYMLWPND